MQMSWNTLTTAEAYVEAGDCQCIQWPVLDFCISDAEGTPLCDVNHRRCLAGFSVSVLMGAT